MRFDEIRERLETPVETCRLAGLHQPQMAFGESNRLVAGQRAEHRDAQRLDRFAGEPAMTLGADAVQHDAGDLYARVVSGDPADNRRRRLPLAGDVMNEHDRPAEQGGDVGAGADSRRAAGRAVKEPHRALCDHDVRAFARPRGEPRDQIRIHRP